MVRVSPHFRTPVFVRRFGVSRNAGKDLRVERLRQGEDGHRLDEARSLIHGELRLQSMGDQSGIKGGGHHLLLMPSAGKLL